MDFNILDIPSQQRIALQQRDLECHGTVDGMRKRLVDFLRDHQTPSTENLLKILKEDGENRTDDNPPPSVSSNSENRDSEAEGTDNEEQSEPKEVNRVRKPLTLTDARIIEIVRKWSIRFDGGSDAVEFIERTEELDECFDIPQDCLLKTLPELLKGRALTGHRNNRYHFDYWSTFSAKFFRFCYLQICSKKL